MRKIILTVLMCLPAVVHAQVGVFFGQNYFKPVPPIWTYVQTVPDSTDGTWTVSITPHAIGNTLVFCASANFSSQPTIGNTSSYTWTEILTTGYFIGAGGSIGQQCWKAQTTTTSAQTITMGGSGNGFHGYAVVTEYSGLAGTLDTQMSSSSATFSGPTITLSPSAGGYLTFCYVVTTGVAQTFAGFTLRDTDAHTTEYIDGVSSSGSLIISGSVGTNPWGMICGVIK